MHEKVTLLTPFLQCRIPEAVMETVLHEFNFFLIGSKMSVSFELCEKHEQNQHGQLVQCAGQI